MHTHSQVLVGKLFAVDALATGPVAPRKVAALAHESRYDPVKGTALEVQELAAAAAALFARTEAAKVFHRFRHDAGVQLHFDAALDGTANGNVEKDYGVFGGHDVGWNGR